MKEKAFISFVLCSQSVDADSSGLLHGLDVHAKACFENYEIIWVIHDSKVQATDKVTHALASVSGNVTVIYLQGKHSFDQAMLAGLDKAMGDFLFEMESASLPVHSAWMNSLFKAAGHGFDIVEAIPSGARRKRRFDPPVLVRLVSRRAVNALITRYGDIRDRGTAYRLTGLKRKVLELDLERKRLRRRDAWISMLKKGKEHFVHSSFSMPLTCIAAVCFFLLFLLHISVPVLQAARGGGALLGLGLSFLSLTVGLGISKLERLFEAAKNVPPYTVAAIEIYKASDQLVFSGMREVKNRPIVYEEGKHP